MTPPRTEIVLLRPSLTASVADLATLRVASKARSLASILYRGLTENLVGWPDNIPPAIILPHVVWPINARRPIPHLCGVGGRLANRGWGGFGIADTPGQREVSENSDVRKFCQNSAKVGGNETISKLTKSHSFKYF